MSPWAPRVADFGADFGAELHPVTQKNNMLRGCDRCYLNHSYGPNFEGRVILV